MKTKVMTRERLEKRMNDNQTVADKLKAEADLLSAKIMKLNKKLYEINEKAWMHGEMAAGCRGILKTMTEHCATGYIERPGGIREEDWVKSNTCLQPVEK